MTRYPVQNLPRRTLGQAPPPAPAVPPCCTAYLNNGTWNMVCSGNGQTYDGAASQEMIGIWWKSVV